MKGLYRKIGAEKRNPNCKGKFYKKTVTKSKKAIKNAC